MEKWRTALFRGTNKLERVNVERGIFQWNSPSLLIFGIVLNLFTLSLRTPKPRYLFGKGKEKLNYLLFTDDLKLYDSRDNDIDSLVGSVKIVSSDIGVESAMHKCGLLKIERGKQVRCEGIDLGEGMMIEEANQEGYKYRGILEREDVCQDEIREMVRKENFKQVINVLKSSFNTWAVAAIRYGTGLIT